MSENTQPNIHKFEIELYEEITNEETGDVIGKKAIPMPAPLFIEATSKAELDKQLAFYRTLGQIPRIVREVPVVNTQTAPIQQSQTPVSSTPAAEVVNNTQMSSPVNQNVAPVEVKTAPKFYSVSGIDIKDDNGKIYQKQWMKLSDKEAENIRLVNSATNKIISTTGKHFEVKKWVLVETTTDDSTLNLED